MKRVILWLGNGVGVIGVAVCAVSGIVRLGGAYTLAGAELGTLFLLGTALMVFACLTKLFLLVDARTPTV